MADQWAPHGGPVVQDMTETVAGDLVVPREAGCRHGVRDSVHRVEVAVGPVDAVDPERELREIRAGRFELWIALDAREAVDEGRDGQRVAGRAVAERRLVVERLMDAHAAPLDGYLRGDDGKRVEVPTHLLAGVADLIDVASAGLLRETVEALLVVLHGRHGVGPASLAELVKRDSLDEQIGRAHV